MNITINIENINLCSGRGGEQDAQAPAIGSPLVLHFLGTMGKVIEDVRAKLSELELVPESPEPKIDAEFADPDVDPQPAGK
jgi:hypothetical protein